MTDSLIALKTSLAEQLAALRGVQPAELPPALLDISVRRVGDAYYVCPPTGSSCATRRAAPGAPSPTGRGRGRAASASPGTSRTTRRAPGTKVLELGCGLALPSVVAARAGAHVLATDGAHRRRRVRRARDGDQRGRGRGRPRRLVRRTATQLVARGPWDLVLAADVLYTSANVDAASRLVPAARRAHRTLLVADPNRAGCAGLSGPGARRFRTRERARTGCVAAHAAAASRLAPRPPGIHRSGGGHSRRRESVGFSSLPETGRPPLPTRARLSLQTWAATPCTPPRGARRPGRGPHPSRRAVDPRHGGHRGPAWPDGVVNVYDDSGMTDTIITAAERWTARARTSRSGSSRTSRTPTWSCASTTAACSTLCGRDCLGYSTSIGRPSDGHSEVLLRSNLGGDPRPLSVWVAAHELGHVLGLHHRNGHNCSVMSPRAFDTNCAPSLAASRPTTDELACVPAPADVDVAAGLYGGAAATRDPRCH